MSRHGYSDDCDDSWNQIRWRGIIASATRGKRGQKFFRDLVAALDAMPSKRLVNGELEENGEVCALGCLGQARGLEIAGIDTYDHDQLGKEFDIAGPLAQEVMFINDEWGSQSSPEERWKIVREWAAKQIRVTETELTGDVR